PPDRSVRGRRDAGRGRREGRQAQARSGPAALCDAPVRADAAPPRAVVRLRAPGRAAPRHAGNRLPSGEQVMGSIWVKEFTGGLDTRRLPETSPGGTLVKAIDGHINRGGEFEQRAAFVPVFPLPKGTVGLAFTKAG